MITNDVDGEDSLKATQLDLFTQPTLATVVRDLKAAMNMAVKESGFSRDQVLDRISDCQTIVVCNVNRFRRTVSMAHMMLQWDLDGRER